MRWDNLFDDLESQLEHELWSEDVDLRAEEERLRLGRMSLRDRLMSLHTSAAGVDYSIRLDIAGNAVRMSPSSFGKDWMSGRLIDETSRRSHVVVPFRSIAGIILDRPGTLSSLTITPAEGGSSLSARLGIAFVLRDLCRRRCELDLVLTSGTVHGTIDRVGRDHCDLAEHEAGTPRRESSVTQYRVVPLDQLLMVRL
ncbi:MAG: hypothetical protein ABIW32_00880 [Terrimesophilobacter sp.]